MAGRATILRKTALKMRNVGLNVCTILHDRPIPSLAVVLLDHGCTGGAGLMNVEQLAERIRAEFEEMPGMVLTIPQASRFFGLDHSTTRTVVSRLVETAHLRWTHRGTIARAA